MGRPRKYTDDNWPPPFDPLEDFSEVNCVCRGCGQTFPSTKKYFSHPPKRSTTKGICKRCKAMEVRDHKKDLREAEYAKRSVAHIRRSRPEAQAVWEKVNGPIPRSKETLPLKWKGVGRKPTSRVLKMVASQWEAITQNLDEQSPATRELVLRIAQSVKAWEAAKDDRVHLTPEAALFVEALDFLYQG